VTERNNLHIHYCLTVLHYSTTYEMPKFLSVTTFGDRAAKQRTLTNSYPPTNSMLQNPFRYANIRQGINKRPSFCGTRLYIAVFKGPKLIHILNHFSLTHLVSFYIYFNIILLSTPMFFYFVSFIRFPTKDIHAACVLHVHLILHDLVALTLSDEVYGLPKAALYLPSPIQTKYPAPLI
jgi:hypothetical protein